MIRLANATETPFDQTVVFKVSTDDTHPSLIHENKILYILFLENIVVTLEYYIFANLKQGCLGCVTCTIACPSSNVSPIQTSSSRIPLTVIFSPKAPYTKS